MNRVSVRSWVVLGFLAAQVSVSGCIFKVEKDLQPASNGATSGGGSGGDGPPPVGNAASAVMDFYTAADVMTARLGVTPDLRPLGPSNGASVNHVANGRNQTNNLLNVINGNLPESGDVSKVSESQLYGLEVIAMGSCKAAVDNNTICTGINRGATMASITSAQIDACANELSQRVFGRSQATALELEVAREIVTQLKGATAIQLGGTALPQARFLIQAVCTAFASSLDGRRG